MNNLYFQLDGDKSAFVRLVSKISRIMKLTLFLVCLSISMSFAMTTNAQSTSLSFKATDQSIKEVLELIESQTDFHFFYNSKLVDINQVISVDIKDKDVFTTLDHIFENSNIRYKVVGKDVILSVKGSKSDQDEKTVTGTVVDETGEPIIGANIVEKGKANGTMSDLNGHFSIVVSSDAVLQISYIGFSLHEEAVKNKNVLQVIMKEDTQKLNEVVVVGYGSVDKKELTSAVTAVSSKDFLQGAFTSPLSMIDGKVSGVNVSNAAAADPNSSPNIQMRGASSIEAGNSPLVIIDGMPGADLRSVANQDIESITILKDGSAAAIYGSRAANGVILVQTKKGKAGKVSISYDGYIDHDMVANQPKVLSVDEFLAHERDVDFGHRLFTMAKNQLLNEFRRQANSPLFLEDVVLNESGDGEETAIERKLSFEEFNHRLEIAKQKLTPRQRELFELNKEQGITITEIAAKAFISEQSVRNQLSQALHVLRKELGKYALLFSLFFIG